MRTRHITAAALVGTALVLAGCATGQEPEASTVAVQGDRVAVVDNDFEPRMLEISAGDTVTWVWEGSANHNVVGDDFESDTQRSGEFQHTFEEAGEHPYRCTLHAGQTGTIVVRP